MLELCFWLIFPALINEILSVLSVFNNWFIARNQPFIHF
jgi:hypothetical protein